jgi:hypothetical protein
MVVAAIELCATLLILALIPRFTKATASEPALAH